MISITNRRFVQFAGCTALGAGMLFFAGGRLMPSAAAQSLSYTKGQNIAPAYEGWEEDADGKKYFVFGYMNKNWEEELDVPVGAENGFAPGNADRGQPTHFLPRRNRFVFRVLVPQGFTEKDELVWTLTANGKTMKAYGSLRTDYKIDDVVIASETGALGAGTSSPTMRANKAPIVKIDGAKTRTVRVGETLTLVTAVTDDGVPKGRTKEQFDQLIAQRARLLGTLGVLTGAAAPPQPAPAAGQGAQTGAAAAPRPAAAAPNPLLQPPARVTVGKNLGLHLSWFVYRGAGDVHFDPPQIKSWEDTRAGANSPWAPLWFAPSLPPDGKVNATVAFSEPGTYVLRALADDGALTGFEDLTVTVTK